MKLSIPTHSRKFTLIFSLIIFNLATQTVYARGSVEDFLELGLEDLLSMEVTSVSKKKQKLKEAAAAIFVISQEDLHRSGVTSIAEALRMVPGVQVARFNANKWAITTRGFNGHFANKLLVLIDGRSVYTPTFSGVYWDLQDTLLADIERIEVIRGPGASLWGANAVNGVINIITRSSAETQGGLVSVGGGQEEEGFASLRYGGYGTTFGENSHGRFYLKAFKRDSFVLESDASDGGDDWESERAGFRIDSDSEDQDSWTVQGDIYNTDANQTLSSWWLDPDDFDRFITPPGPTRETDRNSRTENTGWNLLTRWNHVISEQSESSVQLYYDYAQRKEDMLTQHVDTLDIDFQHNLNIGESQQLIWGVGYRQIKENYTNSFGVSINPADSTTDLYSVFVQDQIELLPDSFYLTLGSKLEHNDYTGIEIQPTIRGLWKTSDTSSLWGSVSRAARTPSRIETHGRIVTFSALVPSDPLAPVPPWMPTVITIDGSEDYDSEKTLAYELGYRIQPLENLSVDMTAFYNDYDDLLSYETLDPETTTFGNKMSGHASGLEIAVDWHANTWWKVKAGYSTIKFNMQLDSDSLGLDYAVPVAQGSSPEHQLSLRSLMDLSNDWKLDFWVYYVDELPVANITAQRQDIVIDSFTSLNMRVGWHPTKDIELSLSGFNLLDQGHTEMIGEFSSDVTEVERAIFVKIRWDF